MTRLRSISEVSSCFLGPRPWHIEIRHRVKTKTSTINWFGCETLKLKIRRLNLWKPTVSLMQKWASVKQTPAHAEPSGKHTYMCVCVCICIYIYIHIYIYIYIYIHSQYKRRTDTNNKQHSHSTNVAQYKRRTDKPSRHAL